MSFNPSQLITTVDIPSNNVGINNVAASGKSNVVALGNGQNVGIGANDPKAGVHIGKVGSALPALYVEDSTGETLSSVAAGDGMFSTLASVPMFTNVSGSKEIFTLGSKGMGTGTLVGGTVDITPAGFTITANSLIFVTRTSTTGDVTTIGTLVVSRNIIANTFTVTSTVATDVGDFNYLIINA